MCRVPYVSIRVTFQDPNAEIVKMNKLFYPKPWLDAVGFFETLEIDADETKAMEASSYSEKGSKHTSDTSSPLCPPPTKPLPSVTTDSDHPASGPGSPSTVVPPALASWHNKIGLAVGALFFIVVGIVVGRWSATRPGYDNLIS